MDDFPSEPTPVKRAQRKEHGCGKIPFPSERAARFGNRRSGQRLRPYWCDLCHAYHVASSEKR